MGTYVRGMSCGSTQFAKLNTPPAHRLLRATFVDISNYSFELARALLYLVLWSFRVYVNEIDVVRMVDLRKEQLQLRDVVPRGHNEEGQTRSPLLTVANITTSITIASITTPTEEMATLRPADLPYAPPITITNCRIGSFCSPATTFIPQPRQADLWTTVPSSQGDRGENQQ